MYYGCLITEIGDLFFLDEKATPRANTYLLDFLKDRRHEVITLFLVPKELKISFDKEDEQIVYLDKETDSPIKYRIKFPWEISKECFIYSQDASLVMTIEKELNRSTLSIEQFIIISSNQSLLDACEKLGCDTQITFWEGTLDRESSLKLEKKLDGLDENFTEIEFIYDIDETISMHGASKDEERAVTNSKLNIFLRPYINKFNQATHSILSSRPDIFKAFSTILTELKNRATKANIKISDLDNLEITYEVNALYIIINKLLGACNELSKKYHSDPDYDANSDSIFAELKVVLKKNDDQLLLHSSSFMILREFQEQTGIKLVLNESSFTSGKVTKKSIVEKKRKENPKRLLVVFEDLPKNIFELTELEGVIPVKIMRENDFQEPLIEKLRLIKEREISNSQGDEEINSKDNPRVYDSDDEEDMESDDEFDVSTPEMTKLGKELEDVNQRFASSQSDFFKSQKKRKWKGKDEEHEDEVLESKTKKLAPKIIIIEDDNGTEEEKPENTVDATF